MSRHRLVSLHRYLPVWRILSTASSDWEVKGARIEIDISQKACRLL